MKKIFLDIVGKKHLLYDNLINYPPDGYYFVTGQSLQDNLTEKLCKNRAVYWFQKQMMDSFIPTNYYKSYFERNKRIPSDTSLIYSSGHPIFQRESWIVDLEYVTHLCGYNKHQFERHKSKLIELLSSEHCKKIMPWTHAGEKTILNTFKSDIIREKVETVHLAVPPKDFKKKYNKDDVTILFVTSKNIPKDFHIKGGKEVFKAFEILNKKHNNIKLIVRSHVPEKIKIKYEKNKNIDIIDYIVPWGKIDSIFKQSDIFLFPSHHTPGLVFLDAMSYELPIVTTDIWANSEMVEDGVNGFLIKKTNSISYYDENFIPAWSEMNSLKTMEKFTDSHIINQLVERMSVLIEDTMLRKKMGINGRKNIENGKFSIKNRNEKLLMVFNNAIGI